MKPQFQPLNIFFSYPHDENAPVVLRLKADLEVRGHTVWFDQDKIKVGDDWRARIINGIQGSQRGVAFLSKHSTRDPGVCLNEIAIGMAEGGGEDFWVSVLVEPFERAQPPLSVTAITWLQWLQMDDWERYTHDVGWYKAKLDQLINVIENPSDATRNADLERLRTCLDPIGFAHELSLHLPNFIGRQWILNRVHSWLDGETNSRVFRIEGGPGMGKTAIALKLTHCERSRIIAVHLCRHNQPDSRSAARMVMSLAFQMATRLPDYRARLLRRPILNNLHKANLEDMAGSLWRELIALPLADQISRQRVAIVIDALDEATEDGNNVIVSLLAKDLDQLPPWVNVVLTGRPDIEVVTKLSRYKPAVLKDDDPENRADLKLYLDKWLTQLVDCGKLNPKQHQVAEDILLNRCSGSILYLSKVREAVEAGDCSLTEPDRLPNGLADTYTLFFERRFGENPVEPLGPWRHSVRPLLELVLASPEPLPLSIARKMLQWDMVADAEDDTLMSLGSLFLKQAKGTIAPFHKSVLDWLNDKEVSRKFFTRATDGHKRLAEFCWNECKKNVTNNMPLRDAYKSYPFRNGVRHLVASSRYADALSLVDYLVNHEQEIESRERDSLRHSAKLFISALGDSRIPEDEAKKIEPFKLQKMLEGLYMTAASRGGIQLLLEYHREVWSEILERFLDTGDYVLRNTIAEVLANDYLTYGDQSRLDAITALVKHHDINHQELGSYALGFVYAERPDLIDKQSLNQIANGKTYPFRSIVGDLLLGLALKQYSEDSNEGDINRAIWTDWVDSSNQFWNPIWDFNKMDVSWLKATDYFIQHQQLPTDISDDVHKAYESIGQMEELRQQIIEEKVLGELENDPVVNYYSLGMHLDYIADALPVLKKSSKLKDIFMLLFAHPLWKVAEEAAAVLAVIVDEEPEAGRYISDLFEHDSWRINYGAAEAAFLARATNKNHLFRRAIELFYKHPEPLLRGNCAENLVAWMLDSGPSECEALFREFEEPICYWLNDQDCWVLEHIYHLFYTLSLSNGSGEHWKLLLDKGVSDILKGEPDEDLWYCLDRDAFLSRIEQRKRSIHG